MGERKLQSSATGSSDGPSNVDQIMQTLSGLPKKDHHYQSFKNRVVGAQPSLSQARLPQSGSQEGPSKCESQECIFGAAMGTWFPADHQNLVPRRSFYQRIGLSSNGQSLSPKREHNNLVNRGALKTQLQEEAVQRSFPGQEGHQNYQGGQQTEQASI